MAKHMKEESNCYEKNIIIRQGERIVKLEVQNEVLSKKLFNEKINCIHTLKEIKDLISSCKTISECKASNHILNYIDSKIEALNYKNIKKEKEINSNTNHDTRT